MNTSLALEVKKLATDEARPGIILRRILEHEDHRHMSRLWLVKELRELFDIDLQTAILTGGWNYWDGSGFDDAELNERLEGKLKLKAETANSGSASSEAV
jgi:hypothetical protein